GLGRNAVAEDGATEPNSHDRGCTTSTRTPCPPGTSSPLVALGPSPATRRPRCRHWTDTWRLSGLSLAVHDDVAFPPEMSVPGCKSRVVHEDFDRCYRAVQSKDARFDGWFVTAVRTTGIYCRPSCPVRPPFARNVRFYPTAAAAQRAGFRACKRCRPDASPGSPEWNIRDDLVARAMRLTADGTVDREGVGGLAAHLGYTTRQLERLLQAEVGAGPLALARAQRAQPARVLIEPTQLPFGDIAFAAGFSSIRQFNDTVRLVFESTPTALRKRAAVRFGSDAASPGTVCLRLPVRKPFAYEGAFGHLAAGAVPGCEEVRDDAYRRSLRLPSGSAVVTLTPAVDHVRCLL